MATKSNVEELAGIFLFLIKLVGWLFIGFIALIVLGAIFDLIF